MTCPVSLNQQVAELAPQFLWQPGLCSSTGQCCFSPPLGISPYFSADLGRAHQSFKAPIAISVRCQLSAWHWGTRPAPSSHSSHSSKCLIVLSVDCFPFNFRFSLPLLLPFPQAIRWWRRLGLPWGKSETCNGAMQEKTTTTRGHCNSYVVGTSRTNGLSTFPTEKRDFSEIYFLFWLRHRLHCLTRINHSGCSTLQNPYVLRGISPLEKNDPLLRHFPFHLTLMNEDGWGCFLPKHNGFSCTL